MIALLISRVDFWIYFWLFLWMYPHGGLVVKQNLSEMLNRDWWGLSCLWKLSKETKPKYRRRQINNTEILEISWRYWLKLYHEWVKLTIRPKTDRTQSCELFGLNTEQLVLVMMVVLVVMLVMGAKSVKSISRNLNYTNSPHPPLWHWN